MKDRYCGNCGAMLKPELVFCDNCGSMVTLDDNARQDDVPEAQDVSSVSPLVAPAQDSPRTTIWDKDSSPRGPEPAFASAPTFDPAPVFDPAPTFDPKPVFNAEPEPTEPNDTTTPSSQPDQQHREAPQFVTEESKGTPPPTPRDTFEAPGPDAPSEESQKNQGIDGEALRQSAEEAGARIASTVNTVRERAPQFLEDVGQAAKNATKRGEGATHPDKQSLVTYAVLAVLAYALYYFVIRSILGHIFLPSFLGILDIAVLVILAILVFIKAFNSKGK